MRLTKNDLVKQFDDLVKQEIINHNRQIEASNKSIREMNEKLNEITHSHSIIINRLSSVISDLEEKNKKLKDDLDNVKKQNLFIHHEINKSIDKKNYDLNIRLDGFEGDLAEIEEEIADLSLIPEIINSFDQILEQQKFFIHSEFHRMKSDCERWFLEYRQEIDNRPSEIPRIQADLEKKISEAKVDAKGVLREMEVLKKEIFVINKKIEMIFGVLGYSKTGRKL